MIFVPPTIDNASALILRELVSSSTPFCRIIEIKRRDWRRRSGGASRVGPWKYEAVFEALDPQVWYAMGEVLYFVIDSDRQLRLVGKSDRRLRDRWRTPAMHDALNNQPLGRTALFHNTAWKAIEEGFAAGQRPPLTISAIFRPQLEEACKKLGGPLKTALERTAQGSPKLAENVETWVCSLKKHGLPLWNKQKTA